VSAFISRTFEKPVACFVFFRATAGTIIGSAPRRGTPTTKTRDWFFQNVRLMKALTQKGYDVNYFVGHEPSRPEDGRRDHARHDALVCGAMAGFDDPKDMVERGFREAAPKKAAESTQRN